MRHLEYLTVSNFRVFRGAEFDLAPITILTGMNNSGKSSVIHAIKIISQYAENCFTKKSFQPYLFQNRIPPFFEGEAGEEFIKKFGKEFNVINKKILEKDETKGQELTFIIGDDSSDFIIEFVFHFDSSESDGKFQLTTPTLIDKSTKNAVFYYNLENPNKGFYNHDDRNYLVKFYNNYAKTENNKGKWIKLTEGNNFNVIDEIVGYKKDFFETNFNSHKMGIDEIEDYINRNIVSLVLSINPNITLSSLRETRDSSFEEIVPDLSDYFITQINSYKKNEHVEFDIDSFNKIWNESKNNLLVVLVYFKVIELEVTDFYSSFFKAFQTHIVKQITTLLVTWSFIDHIPTSLSYSDRILTGKSDYRELVTDFKKLYSGFHDDNINLFLKKQLIRFNIGEDIKIISGEDEITTNILVPKDGEDVFLADLGFGISKILPILLKICTTAMTGIDIKILLIEEPESNLHPALQSKLADMFFDAYETFDFQFIIETHSEYLIRKLQYLSISLKTEMKADDVILYYFYHPNEIPEGEKQVKKITIQKDGSLSDDFGTGFFDEADNIAMSIFSLQQNKRN